MESTVHPTHDVRRRSPLAKLSQLAALGAALVGSLTCDAFTAPGEIGEIVITYQGDTVLIVGRRVAPQISVTVGGAAADRPRLRFTSSDTNVVAVSSHGDTLIVQRRGVATISVTLVGATFGANPPSAERAVSAVAGGVRTTPDNLLLEALGDTVTIQAEALNAASEPIPNTVFDWSSSDTSVAEVGASGQVTAKKNGRATMTATVDGLRDSTALEVRQRLSRFTFTPVAVNFGSLGDALTVVATPRDPKGSVIPLSAAPPPTWESSFPSVANVSSTGRVTALANGEAYVRARAADANDSLRVDVRQVAQQVVITGPDSVAIEAIGDTARLLALSFDALSGAVLNNVAVWQSRNLSVATVDAATGIVRALAVGQARIVARLDNGADSVTVYVTNLPRILEVTPDTVRMTSVGDAVALLATPRNRLGVALPDIPVTWSNPDPSVAMVDQAGLATATGIGTGRIVAVAQSGAEQLADTSVIIVVNSPDSVNIIPTSITLASVNDTESPAVEIKNARGAPLDRSTVTWISLDAGVATASPQGLVRAVGRGTTRVAATNPLNAARTDTVDVVVTNAVVTLTLNRPAAPRTADTLTALTMTLAYEAVPRNAAGAVISGELISWRSTVPTVADVSQTGLATAAAVGTTQIIAEAGTGAGLRADTSTLVVRNEPASIGVAPDVVTLASVGDSTLLTATPLNNLNQPIAGRTLTWSTSAANVVTFLPAGNDGVTNVNPVVTRDTMRIKATGVGTATVTVSGSASTAITVTVGNSPASVDITSGDVTLASIGDTHSPSVDFRNSLGVSLGRDAVTWSSTNTAVATVSNTGVVTAVGVGTATIRASSPANAAITDAINVTVTNAPATLTISPAGTSTLTSIGATINFVATVKNAAGGVIASPSPAATWSSNNAAVGINSTTGVATANANGSAIIITATAGAATNTATVNVGQVASTATSTISAGSLSLTANGTSSTTITVQLKDALGVNLSTGPVTVTMSLFGTGTLGGVTNNGNGTYTAQLTAPTVTGAGTVGGSIGAASITTGNPTVSYIAGTATKYLVNPSSTTPVAGTNVTISANLVDANDNDVTTSGKIVTWSSSGGGAFSAPTSVTNSFGVATVTFTTSTTASTTHTVTAMDNTGLAGTSGAILTVGGAANNYLVTPSTPSPAAGNSITITAQLRDINNNPLAVAGQSVVWTKSNANGSFTPGDATTGTTLTNANGVATITFNTHTGAGTSAVVTATTGGTSGNSATITTVPGAASGATTTIGATSPVTAGGASTITVTARDANSNPLTASGGTVTLATNLGSLSAVTDNGNGTYTATLSTSAAGTATISGTIGGAAITSGNPTVTVTVGAASAAATTITASPTSVAADGAATSAVTVQAKDAQGNNRTMETDAVTLTAAPGGALAVAAGPPGSGTYTATLPGSTAAGVVTITGTINTVAIADDATVTRTAGAATKYIVTSASPSVVAGNFVLVTAQLADVNNNSVATSGKTVAWSKTGTGGSFATPTSLTDASGTAVIAFYGHTVASTVHTVTATDNTALTGTSGDITTIPGAFVKLQLLVPGETAGPGTATGKTGTPTAQTTGTAFTVTVNGVDAHWNVVTTAPNDNIAITSSDANAVLPANNTLSSGTRTFSVELRTAGTATITATDVTNGAITANTSPAITVNAGAFVKLQLLVPGETATPGTATGKTGTPTAQTAGTGFTVTVNAVDANWNVVTGAPNHAIAITTSDPNDVHPANNTLASGTRDFTVTFTTVGSWTVTATDVTDGTKTANTSPSITTNVGAFVKLQLLVPGETAAPGTATGKTGTPTAQTAGTAFSVTVNAVDANWNVVTTAPADNIQITTSDPNDTHPAANTLASGTQTFSVTFTTAGSWTVTATDVTDGMKTANTSPAITTNAGAFVKLQLLVPGETAAPGTATGKTGTPTPRTTGVAFTVTVNAVDAHWNVLTTAPNDAIAISSSDPLFVAPANKTLSSGTQTFSVTLVTVGTSTLTATDVTNGTITANTSPPITVGL